MEPGALASEVARAARIHASQLFRWRQQLAVFNPVTVTPEAHCLVRIAPGILTIAASELLPAFVAGVSNKTGKHGDARRANRGIIQALFGSKAGREEPHSRRIRRGDGVSPKARDARSARRVHGLTPWITTRPACLRRGGSRSDHPAVGSV